MSSTGSTTSSCSSTELWSPGLDGEGRGDEVREVAEVPGLAKRGHIGFQGDHAEALAFRNIRIREVK